MLITSLIEAKGLEKLADAKIEQSNTETCIVKGELSDVQLEGSIFYSTWTDDITWIIDANLYPRQIVPALNSAFGIADLTRHLIAISDITGIYVFNQNADLKYVLPYDKGWSGLTNWTSQGQLVMRHRSEDGLYDGFIIVSLDGNLESHVQLPNILSPVYGAGVAESATSSDILVSSDGSRVVYDATEDSSAYPFRERGLVLAEVSTKSEIWHTNEHHIWENFWSAPAWSPDSSHFAYAQQDYLTSDIEMALVDPSGNENLLTDINHGQTFFVPVSLSWSPDSSKIAFWLWDATWTIKAPYTRPQQEEPNYLYLVDVTTGEIRNMCLPGGQQNVTWSTDGSSLIYNTYENIRWVDLDNGLYVDLPNTSHVRDIFGWLDS